MIDSLNFIKRGLQKLQDEERIRYEGNQVFQEIRQELDSVIANYTAPAPVVAPIVQTIMTQEQLDTVTDTIRDNLVAAIPRLSEISAVVAAQVEASDVAVLAAIAESQTDVIAALTPAPVPA